MTQIMSNCVCFKKLVVPDLEDKLQQMLSLEAVSSVWAENSLVLDGVTAGFLCHFCPLLPLLQDNVHFLTNINVLN